MKLLRGHDPISTIFDLLGSKEDDMTYSLGYVASRSPRFIGALLSLVAGRTVMVPGDAVMSSFKRLRPSNMVARTSRSG